MTLWYQNHCMQSILDVASEVVFGGVINAGTTPAKQRFYKKLYVTEFIAALAPVGLGVRSAGSKDIGFADSVVSCP